MKSPNRGSCYAKSLSRVRLLATPWTAAYQAPPSMGFSRQEYWSGVSLPSPNRGSRQHQRKPLSLLYIVLPLEYIKQQDRAVISTSLFKL